MVQLGLAINELRGRKSGKMKKPATKWIRAVLRGENFRKTARKRPWRGGVVIASANGTEDRGFESRNGRRAFKHCNAVLCNLIFS
jgi:hypothetical protein